MIFVIVTYLRLFCNYSPRQKGRLYMYYSRFSSHIYPCQMMKSPYAQPKKGVSHSSPLTEGDEEEGHKGGRDNGEIQLVRQAHQKRGGNAGPVLELSQC